jgi:L-aminopeptidase/D-esterase-like protein
MVDMIDGVQVGHWTDRAARTGCTVVVLPDATVASGEVRGGAPATREFALLAPERAVDRVHAVCLSGGSAFGLASADGVVAELAGRGVGFPTPGGPVPIVVGLALYDLTVGDGTVRPGPEAGGAATRAASGGPVVTGPVGAGTGATVGKWDDPADATPGGIGAGRAEGGGVTVVAVLAVNAAGWIDDGSDRVPRPGRLPFGGSTTIGVVVTDAPLDKVGCLRLAQGGHEGLTRSLVPAHTGRDGDAIVAAATGGAGVEVDVDLLAWMAATSVERAVRSLP